MRLTVIRRPHSVGTRDGAETPGKASTVTWLRTAGAWARAVAAEMDKVFHKIFLRRN